MFLSRRFLCEGLLSSNIRLVNFLSEILDKGGWYTRVEIPVVLPVVLVILYSLYLDPTVLLCGFYVNTLGLVQLSSWQTKDLGDPVSSLPSRENYLSFK